MKSNILTIILNFVIVLLITNPSNAQISDFKLSQYKNPIYLYQTLDLNLDLNSSFSANNLKSNSTISGNNFVINSGAGATYSRYVNTVKTQAEIIASFDAGIGNSSYHQSRDSIRFESNSAYFSHQEGISLKGIKRFFNTKQNYLEIDGEINFLFNQSNSENQYYFHDTINTSSNGKQSLVNSGLQGSVLIGKGRIEQVQDARLALYILEDLQALNREKRLADDQDVLALAQEITQLKYKRFFDNRLRKIAEITAIDEFLQKNGLITSADAVYFTSLNDNWEYANNPVRYSGKRVYTGVDANFNFDYQTSLREHTAPYIETDENMQKLTLGGLFYVLGIDNENPQSISWQKSASAKLGVGIENSILTKKDDNNTADTKHYLYAIPSIKLSAEYGIGYYPNSRTWLTFKWWLLSGFEKQKKGVNESEIADFRNTIYLYTGPRLNAYYYLSDKLRFSLVFNGEFRFDESKNMSQTVIGIADKTTETWWNQQINAALTYSLF